VVFQNVDCLRWSVQEAQSAEPVLESRTIGLSHSALKLVPVKKQIPGVYSPRFV
jgi:hypothetical protein